MRLRPYLRDCIFIQIANAITRAELLRLVASSRISRVVLEIPFATTGYTMGHVAPLSPLVASSHCDCKHLRANRSMTLPRISVSADIIPGRTIAVYVNVVQKAPVLSEPSGLREYLHSLARERRLCHRRHSEYKATALRL